MHRERKRKGHMAGESRPPESYRQLLLCMCMRTYTLRVSLSQPGRCEFMVLLCEHRHCCGQAHGFK